MSTSLVFSGVGLHDNAMALPPVAYLHGENSRNDGIGKVDLVTRKRSAIFRLGEAGEEGNDAAAQSSESSSIGAASSSSSSAVEDGEEAESRKKEGGFGSLDSLEESLPIKRGLSNFFSGKSKSFASLADASAARASDLAKRENPFNKRRRILMAFRARRASCGSLVSFSTSMTLMSPDQTLEEGDDGDEEEEEDDGGDTFSGDSISNPIFGDKLSEKKVNVIGEGSFRSAARSFSLSDLQHA